MADLATEAALNALLELGGVLRNSTASILKTLQSERRAGITGKRIQLAFITGRLEHTYDRLANIHSSGRWWKSLMTSFGHYYITPLHLKIDSVQSWMNEYIVRDGLIELAYHQIIPGLIDPQVYETISKRYQDLTGWNRQYSDGAINSITDILVAGFTSGLNDESKYIFAAISTLAQLILRIAENPMSRQDLERIFTIVKVKLNNTTNTAPVPKRIMLPHDEDIVGLIELHQRKFNKSLGDDGYNIDRWFAEAIEEQRLGIAKLDEFWVVLKHGRNIIGYVNAQQYYKSNYMFISYLAVDREYEKAAAQFGILDISSLVRDGMQQMFDELLANTRTLPRAIIAEIDKDTCDESLQRLFTMYAARRGWKLYKIDMTYVQPAVTIDQPDGILEQDLICVLGDEMQAEVRKMENMELLSRNGVLGILSFVLIEVYGDTYEHTEFENEYRRRMKRMLSRYRRQIKGPVPLVSLSGSRSARVGR
ncbi:MAG TPA: hypothetical protein VEI03_01460 [Stellaceae bacterium]|nr:hypothetical protein [Stellaceae bacterium]